MTNTQQATDNRQQKEATEAAGKNNERFKCKGCKHLNVNNNPHIGHDICCGEYCNYTYKPIRR